MSTYICLWLNQAASNHDKIAVRNGINVLFQEPKEDNYIDVNSLPVAYLIANPTVKGWFLVIDEQQLDNLKVPADRKLVSFLNDWKNTNMDNPNHLRWDKGTSWEQVLIDNGLKLEESDIPGIPVP